MKGATHFRNAIEIDTQYAGAYAGLADSLTSLGFWGHVQPEEGAAKGKVAALKAVELDASLSEAQSALGFAMIHHDYDFLAAEKACRKAVELDPRSALAARTLSYCLVGTRRCDEGIAEALRAVHLDPYGLPWRWSLAIMLYMARQYDRAIIECSNALDLDANFAPVLWVLALAYLKKGRIEEAIVQAEKSVSLTGESPFFLGALGHCYAAAARVDDMRRILTQIQSLGMRCYGFSFWQAVVRGPIAEERDDAFRHLEDARVERAPWLAWSKTLPLLDCLRADARFDDLVRRMKLS